ncbi:elongation factor P maturation arginine rhamnosyltransferase EarP, partial [Pseudomonas viridiflava]|uniref:elongation factor P maturation arginine rhamnosyltransferase EarP n=1 Tax=Pseudomonas viridiflava TaxID=33069 RepID=UPI000F03FC04
RLLWCCDFNVVRREDSFVRAQWAARPMLWHIYQQDGDAHEPKLDAFLDLYCAGLSAEAAQAMAGLWRSWSAGQPLGEYWRRLSGHWPPIRQQ